MVEHAYNHSAGEAETAEIFRVHWSLFSHPSVSDPRPVRGFIPKQNKTKKVDGTWGIAHEVHVSTPYIEHTHATGHLITLYKSHTHEVHVWMPYIGHIHVTGHLITLYESHAHEVHIWTPYIGHTHFTGYLISLYKSHLLIGLIKS